MKPMTINVSETTIPGPGFICQDIDGIRLLVGKDIQTRNKKRLFNYHIYDELRPLQEYCTKNNILLDGFLYSPERDHEDLKRITNSMTELPLDLGFYITDLLTFIPGMKQYNNKEPFYSRLEKLNRLRDELNLFEMVNIVDYVKVNTQADFDFMYDMYLKDGYLGIVYKSENSMYLRCATLPTNTEIFSKNRYDKYSGRIVKIVKKGNEFSHFLVKYKNMLTKVNLEESDLIRKQFGNEEVKSYILKHQSDIVGRIIDFTGMEIGYSKSPKFNRVYQFYGKGETECLKSPTRKHNYIEGRCEFCKELK